MKKFWQKYRKRKVSAIITDILLVALIIVMLVPEWRREVGSVFVRVIMTSPDLDEHKPEKLSDDDLALAFSDMEGNLYRLENMLDRPVFVTYWATWCHHCVAELPALDRLNRLAGNHIRIIVMVNEDLKNAEAYIRSKGYQLPLYLQRSHAGELLQSKKIPASFLINTRKELVLKEIGATKWDSDSFIGYLKTL